GFDDVPSPAVNGNPTSKNSQPAATPSNHGKQSNNGSPGTTITPSTTSTPGNNTGAEDKIPGFDDVQSSSNARPSTSASASTPKPPAAKNSPPPPGKIYISFLSLPVKNEADKTKSLPILLNETIGKGIKTVVNNNKQLAVNESKHTIHDNDAVEKDLTALLARTDLKENQKAEKIIDDIMTPHGIHCIYTAQLSGIGPDNIVNLHLYAISKTRKKMFTTNLIFQKDELICEDAGTKKPVLCPEAVKNITNTVQPLLEQAVK
ncbi:MAG TPA: hypothetical protein VK469_13305, partial [Candidatus Kapabacteria bacterium]|nr:hypothetical protein [Candidatus Kapabacteria bacterium]